MSALTTIVVTTTTKVDSAPRDSVLVCRAVHLSNMAAIVHVITIIMVKAISLVRVMVSVRSKAVTANVLRAVTASVHNKAVMVSVLNKVVTANVHNRAVMVVLNRADTVVLSKAVMASVLRAVTVVHNRVAIRRGPVSTLLITIPMQSTA